MLITIITRTPDGIPAMHPGSLRSMIFPKLEQRWRFRGSTIRTGFLHSPLWISIGLASLGIR